MREHAGRLSETLRNAFQRRAINIARMHEAAPALHQLLTKERRVGRR